MKSTAGVVHVTLQDQISSAEQTRLAVKNESSFKSWNGGAIRELTQRAV